MSAMQQEERLVGALVGLACGDAVGAAMEFKPRDSVEPVTDMVGGGPYDLKKGQWTDDTSMALCLGNSLLEQKGFDAADQMDRYLRWKNEGYLSSTGVCFSIGSISSHALMNYEDTKEPYSGPIDSEYLGNGSIMRLAPIPIFYSQDLARAIEMAGESSRTTHGAQLCVDGTKLLAELIHRASTAHSKDEIFAGLNDRSYRSEYMPILDGEFKTWSRDDIKGSDNVVESLIAALWCFYQTDNFRDAILMATNLGDDAETTAAVCGQVAGAYYGVEGIPEDWQNTITMASEIKSLARRLYREGLNQ